MTNKPEPMSTKGREKVTEALIEDLRERSEIGREKYGTYLETFNGRNALVDAYQEVLDLAQYLKQLLMEQGPFKYPEIGPGEDGLLLVFVEGVGWCIDEYADGGFVWASRTDNPYQITHWTYLPGDPE